MKIHILVDEHGLRPVSAGLRASVSHEAASEIGIGSRLKARRWRVRIHSLLIVGGIDALTFAGVAFMVAAGLTIVFGILDFLNATHISFFMLATYVACAANFRMVCSIDRKYRVLRLRDSSLAQARKN